MDVPILTGTCFLHTQQFIEEPKRMNGPGNSTKSLQKSVQKCLFFLDVFHGVVTGLLPLLHGFGYLFKVNVFPVTATNKIK